jgi:uncharacterized protein YaaW (UPF0174 family)
LSNFSRRYAKKYAKARALANKDLDEYVKSFSSYYKDEKYEYKELLTIIENHVKALVKKDESQGVISLMVAFISAASASLLN